MCGIVGIWAPERVPEELRSEVEAALRLLRHRGPDDSGIWTDEPGLALGHARLSILELSELGHQPMHSHDGRFVMSFNGEVYNFADVRRGLEKRGHSFSGNGDTEVVLAAFQEWGPAALQQFIGMFALALWDRREKELNLIRDRVGVKPLYYFESPRGICFASELKAFRTFAGWKPEIDLPSLGEYLQYGYIAGDRTIYKGVHKLRPGHRLTKREGQPASIESYWSVEAALGGQRELSSAEELEELLQSAFDFRMVSDVPVGVYLSGGVDSSLVTALLARSRGSDLHTFTIGFEEDSFDEARWARVVAEHCGTTHCEYRIGKSEALEIARRWGTLYDEPFGDTSGIPTLLVSRLAREQVKVVLSADGGDELFSGYEVYGSVLDRAERLQRVPKPLRRASSGLLLKALPPRLGGRGGGRVHKAHRLARMLPEPGLGELLDSYLSYWQPEEIVQLTGVQPHRRRAVESYPGGDVDKLSLWDFDHYLPEDILTKVDRSTMQFSLEGREPLLDHRLVERAFTLPVEQRRGSLGPKHALKEVLYRHVPREFVDRPKHGFSVPLAHWLRRDLKELVQRHLSETNIQDGGILDPTIVSKLVRGFYEGNANMATPLWFVLAFEMWRSEWY